MDFSADGILQVAQNTALTQRGLSVSVSCYTGSDFNEPRLILVLF